MQRGQALSTSRDLSLPSVTTSSAVDLVLVYARHHERVGLHSATWLGRMSGPLHTSSSERFGGAVFVMVVGAEPTQANCAVLGDSGGVR